MTFLIVDRIRVRQVHIKMRVAIRFFNAARSFKRIIVCYLFNFNSINDKINALKKGKCSLCEPR